MINSSKFNPMKYFLSLYFCVASFSIFANGDFTINQYHINANVQLDGSIIFTETISLRFHKQKHGIIRKIPIKGNLNGFIQTLTLTDISVENFNFSIKKNIQEVEIKIGDKNKKIVGEQQYIITYVANNGILNFENHEEIYWTLIGGDWNAEIKNASFEILLPKDITLSEDDLVVYTGDIGDKTNYANISFKNNVVSGNALTILGKGKHLTVGIKLPKGYIYNSETPLAIKKKPIAFFDKYLVLPLGILFSFIALFFKFGRNKNHKSTKELFYPPENLLPSEVGTFYDFKVNKRDIISLIPYWGTKGLIQLKSMDGDGETSLYLEKLKELPATATTHEKYFFNSLFRDSDLIFLNELGSEFYSHYTKTYSLLKKEALEERLYDKDSTKYFHSNLLIFLILACIAIGIVFIIKIQSIAAGILFILSGIVMLIIKNLEPKRSGEGQRLHRDLTSFYQTILNPNVEKLNSIISQNPLYFEHILPYAIAFGIEKQWNERFTFLGQKTPDWYVSEHNNFNTFSRDIKSKTLSKQIVVPPVADSRSSSFGGGGSAGGGFGGGGGSSW